MIELKHTPAHKHFKNLIGQTNHFLITILIGLEGVKNGKVTKGDSFNVSWNPESAEKSAKRSRIFARNSALSWAIDALDSYLGFLRRKPFQISDSEYLKNLESRSVYNRFNSTIDYLEFDTDFSISLIHLGIQWRNNLVHFHAENELDHDYATYLRNSNKKDIEKRFRGLDSKLLLENFKANKSPTLKEVAGIIQSIIFLVTEMDKKFINYFNALEYCEEIIIKDKIQFEKLIKTKPDLINRRIENYFITKGFTKSEILEASRGINQVSIQYLVKRISTK